MPALNLTISRVPVRIETDSDELRSIFADYFRHHLIDDQEYRDGADRIAPILVSLRAEGRLPDSEGRLLTAAGGVELRELSRPDIYEILTPAARFRILPGAGEIDGRIAPPALESPHLLTNTWALFPLLLALRARGRYQLHAAAVISPEDELWLICGPQRSGKTSLTTALGISGWRPIADDTILLSRDGTGYSVDALRKRFHVSSDILERWSLTAEAPVIPGGRRGFDGLTEFSTLGDASRTFDRVTGILMTRIGDAPASELRPLSKGACLTGLAAESAFFQLLSDRIGEHWQLLATLARDAGTWRMTAGRDILDDPRRAGRLISGLQAVDRT